MDREIFLAFYPEVASFSRHVYPDFRQSIPITALYCVEYRAKTPSATSFSLGCSVISIRLVLTSVSDASILSIWFCAFACQCLVSSRAAGIAPWLVARVTTTTIKTKSRLMSGK
ncbi:unnamed protein product [Peronospora belbahrii]|uniref:Uncharacterized protein n=1 Tax=Peronospora belbahrii TaxID=622444 RepID=A0ABN8CNW2_9STRA|nr:unnamed protein product [Peronospora belbahrii]